MGVVWCKDTESDEQSFLATESGYQGVMIVIRGLDDIDAGRKLAGAVWAGDCGKAEATSLQERFGNEATTSSASL